jgi:hypothetical protein
VTPTAEEEVRRESVRAALWDAIRTNQTIKLPPFDPARSVATVVAPASAGLEPNAYGGTVGELRYQFEGEDDLLHLMVVRRDAAPLSVESAQAVLGWLLPELPVALVWLKPGEISQHFYFGHDELLREG